MNDTLLAELIDCSVGDRPRARALLTQHPELRDARYLHDETALHFLAIEGFVDAVEFLAGEGFDLEATNEFGDTALVDVVMMGNEAAVTALLRLGANPNASGHLGSALTHAIGMGRAEILDLLLEAGAQVAPSAGLELALALPKDEATKARILASLERHGHRA